MHRICAVCSPENSVKTIHAALDAGFNIKFTVAGDTTVLEVEAI